MSLETESIEHIFRKGLVLGCVLSKQSQTRTQAVKRLQLTGFQSKVIMTAFPGEEGLLKGNTDTCLIMGETTKGAAIIKPISTCKTLILNVGEVGDAVMV